MKYRVVGWTYYEDTEILDSGNTIGFAERNAIIDEIRKRKYLFSGWHHQESWDGVVPILNDGRKRCYSQRGWGGVMAEAYNHMKDYDYASFTFYQSIPGDKLRFAPNDFNIYEFEPEAVENEHFRVNVSKELFEIARVSNPFYLEDLKELRYIDHDDIITLVYNDEELTFVVKDIDRNKTDIGLKDAKELIKGEFKIIVKHKPLCERKLSKAPLVRTRNSAFDMFKEAIDEYDYDVVKEILDHFNVNYIAEHTNKKKTNAMLSRFVREYINDSYKQGTVVQILQFVNNFKLYEEIASKLLENNKSIYITFINHYKDDKNMDEYILKFVSQIKQSDAITYDGLNILLKGIALKPDNKSLRKKYYKEISCTRLEGLSIMAGANLFKYLRKDDKRLIELDKYNTYDDDTIMKIVEYLTYPNDKVKTNAYPYNLPKIYEENEKVIDDGVKAYQEYIKERFDVDSIMEDMILHGIDKRCFEMDRYLDGERHAAYYVCALDVLTNYKYGLREKALAKYASKYENFKAEIEDVYKQ